jgi:hypothetical protein
MCRDYTMFRADTWRQRQLLTGFQCKATQIPRSTRRRSKLLIMIFDFSDRAMYNLEFS